MEWLAGHPTAEKKQKTTQEELFHGPILTEMDDLSDRNFSKKCLNGLDGILGLNDRSSHHKIIGTSGQGLRSGHGATLVVTFRFP